MCQSGKQNRRRDRIHPSARDPAVRRILNNHATKNHSTFSKHSSTFYRTIQTCQNRPVPLPRAAQKDDGKVTTGSRLRYFPRRGRSINSSASRSPRILLQASYGLHCIANLRATVRRAITCDRVTPTTDLKPRTGPRFIRRQPFRRSLL